MTKKVAPKIEQWMIEAAFEYLQQENRPEFMEDMINELARIIASHAPTDEDLLEDLLERQRQVIVELRLEKRELREQAIAALRRVTGKAFVECEDLLTNAHAPSDETICPQCGWDTLTRSWQHAPKASEAAAQPKRRCDCGTMFCSHDSTYRPKAEIEHNDH